MCDVLDLLLKYATVCEDGSCDRLTKAITTFVRLHKRAHPHHILSWKWHALLHIPIQMESRGRAQSAFAMERRHKVMKEFGEDVTNLTHYEKTVTMRMLNHQVDTFSAHNGQIFRTGTYLNSPYYTLGGQDFCMPGDVLVSRAASHNMIHTSTGDVVFYGGAI